LAEAGRAVQNGPQTLAQCRRLRKTPGRRGAARAEGRIESRRTRMASTSSFDVTTGVDMMEVTNAVDQATKEITQRYDFKGLKVGIELLAKDKKIVLAAPDEFKLKAVWDVLQTKMVRRQVPLKNLDPGKVEPAAGASVRQEIALKDGLTADQARAIAKTIKDEKLKKVQAAIQGDTVRVSSPDKDALQGVIALLKGEDYGVELRFGNFRTN